MRLLGALAVLLVSTQLLAQSVGYRRTVETLNVEQGRTTAAGYVFDITVQNVEQLDVILDRADKLRDQFSPGQHGRIALVLHGQELMLFRKSNYRQFMAIVDKARSLDRHHLIDIKACQTGMRSLQIDQSELPDFIEQVPFAPVEIQRLEREQGYTRL